MLISGRRLQELAADKINNPAVLNDIFEEIDAMPEPLESWVIIGDFWDEAGYDDEGYWHESDLRYGTDFVLDEAGNYYGYIELYSEKPRKAEAVKVSIEKVRGYRYYVLGLLLFLILFVINSYRAKSYNELPFNMADM